MIEAQNLNGIPVNGKRSRLADAVPLAMPYKIDIFPIYGCNFKCGYCIHSLPEKERGHICNNRVMSLDVIEKLVESAKCFGGKLKAIHFAGYGEPLLHPQIAEMVKQVVDGEIAEVVDIVTNGALLEQMLSKKLLDAGLGKLRISLQGMDAAMYKRISAVDIDMEAFRQNLADFKEMRDKGDYATKIYIKILDAALGDYTEEDFYEVFSPLCDYIAIEHLEPLVNEIDYGEKFAKQDFDTNVKGNKAEEVSVCPWPFYSLLINPDGDAAPCCNHYKPIVLGNVLEESVVDIWRSEKTKNFQKQMLAKNRSLNPVCENCNNIKYQSFPEDNIDEQAEEILQRYE